MKKVSLWKGLLLLIAVMLFGMTQALAVAPGENAIVTSSKEYVVLRKTNSNKSGRVIRIPTGGQVSVLELTRNGFAKVQYFDKTGYLQQKELTTPRTSSYKAREETYSGHPIYCGNFGTAKRIEERTVIVSIFADDRTTSWNFNRKADVWLRLRNRFNLSGACTWLTEKVRYWREKPGGFVWDWWEHSDLYYSHAFSEDLIHGVNDPKAKKAMIAYIDKEIPTKRLVQKYNAENIIYFVYLNAPKSSQYRSWAMPFGQVEPDKYGPEVCVIVPYGRGRENGPAVFAHEMMHCFGAYDLYQTNKNSPIPKAYVNYAMSHKPNDVMNHCYFSDLDIVTVKFSEIDAYYVGLIRSCEAVRKWKMGESLFDRLMEN